MNITQLSSLGESKVVARQKKQTNSEVPGFVFVATHDKILACM